MKKRISILLILALCLSLAVGGVTAAAANRDSSAQTQAETDVSAAETQIDTSIAADIVLRDSTDSVTVTEEGVYRVTGTLSDGQIVVDAKDAKVTLLLDDVNITCTGSAAIYVAEADKVTLSLAEGSENTLRSLGEFADSADEEIDAAVFGRDDITIQGEGSLTVESETGHGIVSKDDLKIKGGTIEVTAAKKGLSGNDSVEISGGTVTVDSGKDAVHAENADDPTLGNILVEGGKLLLTSGSDGMDASGSVTVQGGSVTIAASDDAVHAESTLSVTGGTLLVTRSSEGLEAKVIEITGGDVDITASDDGLNATAGSTGTGWGRGGGFAAQSGVAIRISGGATTVNAGGDGVDSNGDLIISGGELYVSGPTNSGNGALDYNGTGAITGGVVVAAGSAGMAETLTASGDQGVILYTLSGAQSGGSTVTLTDDSGKTLAEFTPSKTYQCVIVSAPGLKSGGTCTLSCGSVAESITLSTLNWTNGGAMGGMMDGRGGMGGFGQFPGGGQSDAGIPPEGWQGGGPGTRPDGSFGGPGGFGGRR